MATLQDVAKRAGVSTATVSKVLSNTPYFTEETRVKVMAAVEALNYVPHLGARALSMGKTHIVAVVFPYVYDAIFKDPLVMQILEGIEAESTQHGYNLLLSTPRLTKKGPDLHFQQMIRSGYLDGVIAIDNVPLASVAQTAQSRDIPTVVIGYADSQYYVRSDDRSGGQQSAEYILGLGHRNIGIITVPEQVNYAIDERLNGILKTLNDAGVILTSDHFALGDYSTVGGKSAARELLDRFPALTALICLNDRMALGAIQSIREMGKSVPDDVSVIGYDDIAISAIANPSLTTINQQAMALGQVAAQMLFDILNGNQPESARLPVKLVERNSTKPM